MQTDNISSVNSSRGAKKNNHYSQAHKGPGNSKELGSMTKDINQRYAFWFKQRLS